MRKSEVLKTIFALLILSFAGCAASQSGSFSREYKSKEAGWIKEGKPIIFEARSWYPTEYIENHIDSEMDYVDQFQNVPFYVERRQIKPFDRIYTKFDYHKYRLFLEKKGYDFDRN